MLPGIGNRLPLGEENSPRVCADYVKTDKTRSVLVSLPEPLTLHDNRDDARGNL